MKYLLDTDHLSILQRQAGKDFITLSAQISLHPLFDFAVSTVSFHEQILGSHAYINRARNLNDIVKGYDMMARLLISFQFLPLVMFDAGAAEAFDRLQSKRIQLATMDARIAAIALFRELILLTRNHRDFIKVPGLAFEDWTS